MDVYRNAIGVSSSHVCITPRPLVFCFLVCACVRACVRVCVCVSYCCVCVCGGGGGMAGEGGVEMSSLSFVCSAIVGSLY